MVKNQKSELCRTGPLFQPASLVLGTTLCISICRRLELVLSQQWHDIPCADKPNHSLLRSSAAMLPKATPLPHVPNCPKWPSSVLQLLTPMRKLCVAPRSKYIVSCTCVVFLKVGWTPSNVCCWMTFKRGVPLHWFAVLKYMLPSN